VKKKTFTEKIKKYRNGEREKNYTGI